MGINRERLIRNDRILFMGRIVLIVALLMTLGVGGVFSYRDYKEWKNEELKNYGHGPGGLYANPLEAKEHFENQFVGIKFNYPSEWKIEVNKRFVVSNPKLVFKTYVTPNVIQELVGFERVTDGGKEEVGVNVGIVAKTNLVDYVNADIVKQIKAGKNLVGERQYINSDRSNWTIVNFVEKDMAVKRAYAISGERMFVIEFRYPPTEEMKVLRTYEEFIKNVIVI